MTRLTDVDICIAKIKDLPVTYDSETVQRCIEVLSNAQTIDAVPVKHGKWIDFSMSVLGVPEEVCGVCGKWSLGMGKNYCPHCGARMDEE